MTLDKFSFYFKAKMKQCTTHSGIDLLQKHLRSIFRRDQRVFGLLDDLVASFSQSLPQVSSRLFGALNYIRNCGRDLLQIVRPSVQIDILWKIIRCIVLLFSTKPPSFHRYTNISKNELSFCFIVRWGSVAGGEDAKSDRDNRDETHFSIPRSQADESP